MDPKVERLVNLIDGAVDLLKRDGTFGFWASWFDGDAQLIRAGDANGLNHLLRAFGGMGSLNDVILVDEKNDERFLTLKNAIYLLARELRHEEQIASA